MSISVFILEAVHPWVPGVVRRVYRTQQAADFGAAELVNLIRQDLGLPGDARADDWQAKIESTYEEARLAGHDYDKDDFFAAIDEVEFSDKPT